MRLVSDHIIEGRPGPTFPPVYPTLEGVDLGDIQAFTKGQPWGDYARMRAEAMPGEDPKTLKTPEELAPHLVRLASPDWMESGKIFDFPQGKVLTPQMPA